MKSLAKCDRIVGIWKQEMESMHRGLLFLQVTWVEHVEVDNKGIDPSYQMLVSSGMGFGARRWLPSLQRQCERIASLQRQTSNTLSGRNTGN